MADEREADERDTPPGEPLAAREPRPFVVHWAVATAVVFLATVILLWFILGVPLFLVVIGSALVGLAVAPYTSGSEVRALAQRRQRFEASQNEHDSDTAPDGDAPDSEAPDSDVR